MQLMYGFQTFEQNQVGQNSQEPQKSYKTDQEILQDYRAHDQDVTFNLFYPPAKGNYKTILKETSLTTPLKTVKHPEINFSSEHL